MRGVRLNLCRARCGALGARLVRGPTCRVGGGPYLQGVVWGRPAEAVQAPQVAVAAQQAALQRVAPL